MSSPLSVVSSCCILNIFLSFIFHQLSGTDGIIDYTYITTKINFFLLHQFHTDCGFLPQFK